jgi:hypothetical protein
MQNTCCQTTKETGLEDSTKRQDSQGRNGQTFKTRDQATMRSLQTSECTETLSTTRLYQISTRENEQEGNENDLEVDNKF